MSLLPVILSELDSLRRRPVDIFDQYFGDGLLRDDLVRDDLLHPMLSHRHYLRPWRVQLPRQSGISHVTDDKDGFKINLDVQQFKPEELNVKVVDGCVVVEGKHEERQDEHGYIQRQFTRRYKLPGHINPESVTSNLSSDGVLMVSATTKALPAPGKERPIPITQTQAPAVTASKKQENNKIEKNQENKKMEH